MNIRDLLMKHEGLRLKPYRCTAGKLTIGVGRNLEDVGISAQEAQELLDNDIFKVQKQAAESFDWYFDLNKARRDVIVSMIFNLGLEGFRGFKKTIKHIVDKEYEAASEEMLNSKWAQQVGKRAYELSEMMRTGAYYDEFKEG